MGLLIPANSWKYLWLTTKRRISQSPYSMPGGNCFGLRTLHFVKSNMNSRCDVMVSHPCSGLKGSQGCSSISAYTQTYWHRLGQQQLPIIYADGSPILSFPQQCDSVSKVCGQWSISACILTGKVGFGFSFTRTYTTHLLTNLHKLKSATQTHFKNIPWNGTVSN